MLLNNAMTWYQFSNLPHIACLPYNKQLIEYQIYNEHLMTEQLMLEQLNAQNEYTLANAVGGANNNTAVDLFPGGGTGAVTFNGTSQYFTALNSDVVNWLPGTGDFTIEFFVKNGSQSVGAPRIFSLGFDTGATIGISQEGGGLYVWPYGSELFGTYPANYGNRTAWMHVAICRSGTTTKLFMGGVLKATKTGDTRNINDSINTGFDLNVGVDNPSAGSPNWWAGKLTNFRWDNSAIYTGSSLVVPTAPLSRTATTKLLMLGGGVSNPVYDAAKLNILVNNGSVWDAETPF
jgi:hypothetical protein